MVFQLKKTSWAFDKSRGIHHRVPVELNSIEDLLELVKRMGHPIIVFPPRDGCYTIEVYDGHRE